MVNIQKAFDVLLWKRSLSTILCHWRVARRWCSRGDIRSWLLLCSRCLCRKEWWHWRIIGRRNTKEKEIKETNRHRGASEEFGSKSRASWAKIFSKSDDDQQHHSWSWFVLFDLRNCWRFGRSFECMLAISQEMFLFAFQNGRWLRKCSYIVHRCIYCFYKDFPLHSGSQSCFVMALCERARFPTFHKITMKWRF